MGQTISFKSGKTVLQAHLSIPDGIGPFPAVVVIHEMFGLNDNIKEIADRFSGLGYVALAIDLFSGRNKTLCIMRVMSDLLVKKITSNSGVKDLKASLSFLVERSEVDRERLGAIGFCMGGSYAVAWGSVDERLKVIAPYYSMNPRPMDAVKRSCPVVASFPTGDFSTKPGQILEAALARYNVPHDFKFYEGSKHSFFNDRGPNYDKEAAEDSWQRVVAFFQTQLGKE